MTRLQIPDDERVATEDASSGDISDAAIRKLLIIVGATLVVAVLAAVMVAGVLWAIPDEPEAPLGTVDIGFLQDMIDHHEQALTIANIYLDNNPTGSARSYANEVVIFQTMEIARMEEWLAEAGLGRGAPDRTAMAWMGMGTSVDEMPGMQTPERIAELSAARGSTADRLFFEIMGDHHVGGAHMADAAAVGADRAAVRKFAEKMAYNQKIEGVEYRQAIDRLGLR